MVSSKWKYQRCNDENKNFKQELKVMFASTITGAKHFNLNKHINLIFAMCHLFESQLFEMLF